MHILHLIKTSEGAGWAINLLKELKIKYKDITFSVVIPSGGKYFQEYKILCRNVYQFEFKLNGTIITRGIQLKKIVLHDKPDIIHSWFTQTTLYTRLFLRNIQIPTVFQVVGPAHLENLLFKIGDIKSARYNDYWIATSNYILDKYKKGGVSEDRIFLNYAYVDILGLLESKKHVAFRDLRQDLNINQNIKIIGTASYIYPPKFYQSKGVKGHEYLLTAFSSLIKQRDDVVLVIAGASFHTDNKYEKKLRKMAAAISPDKIFFTGRYNDICEIISNFDIFLYLSKTENLGGVFESLLFEIPTISSNNGALPELVINNFTGFNLNPNKKNEIIEKINFLLDNDSECFTRNGKELVLKKFQKNEIISGAYNIYHKIISNTN